MKRFFIFFVTSSFIYACNSTPAKNSSSPEVPAGTATQPVATAPPVQDSVVLKNITLNEKTVSAKNKYAALKPLNALQIDQLDVKKIDENSSVNYKYYATDTLYHSNNSTVLLITRIYTEENIIWIAIYNAKQKLADSRQVYYDNAEGFSSIESRIHNNGIEIRSSNEFAETDADKLQVATYYVNKENKLVKK